MQDTDDKLAAMAEDLLRELEENDPIAHRDLIIGSLWDAFDLGDAMGWWMEQERETLDDDE